MAWLYLILAIVFEVAGTVCMKMSYGLTKLTPSILMFVSYLLCFSVFALALKRIDVSVAYAIWAGVGVTLISIVGVIFFSENINTLKIVSTLLIIAGVVGLKLSGSN